MKAVGAMNQAEVAAYVQSHLRKRKIEVVLSGGAAVAIYNKKYVSLDIDLVIRYTARKKEIKKAMEEISFLAQGRYYHHKDTKYFIEILSGPLGIGSENINKFKEMKFSTGTLKLLTPTDSVKDRLAGYYHWGDRQSLAQAVLISKAKKINLKEIENWSKREGKLEEFQKIKRKFE